jgi:hypothetical protein
MAEGLTLNLGSREEGLARRSAYEAAWKEAGAKSLNHWCKTLLDQAAGFSWESVKRS